MPRDNECPSLEKVADNQAATDKRLMLVEYKQTSMEQAMEKMVERFIGEVKSLREIFEQVLKRNNDIEEQNKETTSKLEARTLRLEIERETKSKQKDTWSDWLNGFLKEGVSKVLMLIFMGVVILFFMNYQSIFNQL